MTVPYSSRFELLPLKDGPHHICQPLSRHEHHAVTMRIATRMAALYGPSQDTEAGAPTIRLAQRTPVAPAVEAWRIPAYRRQRVVISGHRLDHSTTPSAFDRWRLR
jgi:hypothetical protein